MFSQSRAYLLLFLLSIVTTGGSILFLSYTATHTDSLFASQYPAPGSNDAWGYGQIAKNVVERGVFSQSTTSPYVPDTFRTPVYPLFVAFFYGLSGSFYPVLIVQMFIVFLTSLLIYAMARKLLGTSLGLLAPILYILEPNTLLSASLILTENLFVFFFMAALYVMFFATFRNLYLRFLVAGVLIGVTALIRPVAILIPMLILPGYVLLNRSTWTAFKQQIFAIAIFVIALGLVLSPWLVRNHAVSGVWGLSSVGAYALFDANTPYFLAATHHITVGAAKTMLRESAGFPVNERSPLGIEKAAAMQHAALGVMFNEPFAYAKYHLTSTISFFVSGSVHDYWRVWSDMHPDFHPAPEPSLVQALNPFSLSLLITVVLNHGWFILESLFWAVVNLLAVLAIIRSKHRGYALMFFGLVVCFALATGPISHARYRVPVNPLLFMGALLAIDELAKRRLPKAETVV